MAHAGRDLRNLKPAPLVIDDGIERVASSTQGSYIPGLDNPMNLNWFPVDSMANAFGPASTRVRPIVYDPATNVLALIHRGAAPYALGSGQLWYNISRNAGVTWRRAGELNGGSAITCRYPSAAISNPANNSDTNQCLFVYVAPNLEQAGGFGLYTYGVDFPLGGGAGSGTLDNIDMGNNSAAAHIWGVPNTNWIVWASTAATTSATPNDSRVWRTDDYVTINSFVPPTWTDAVPNFQNAISFIPGMANSTGSYFGMHGLFGFDTLANAFNGGYSKSTDNGATWSQWIRPQPDWMIATGLPPRYDLYDYVQPPGGTVSYNGDMTVDGNGRVHFFHVVVDSPWTTNDPRGILEVYETATNVWAYKWVTQNLNTYTGLGYPAPPPSTTPYLQQTNNCVRTSVSPDGQVLSLVWLDAATSAPADSFPDVWFSHRRINSTTWSTPANLTQTPGYPEMLLHAAPIMKSNGGNSYTVFLGRSYQCNINTYPPDNGVKTTFFVAPYTFTTTGVAETGQPASFKLEQNYPNPFNPTTTIRYSVAQAGRVSLKVFNTLGQEVATLVDGIVAPGEHQANFDADRFSSGVYVYKMTSGTSIESRKMLLLK
jgi:hypothetical protein